MAEPSKCPQEFKPFFWDIDFETLDLQEHRIFLIERLLNEGDHRTLRWLLQVYSWDDIREAVCKSRGLTPKTARYWQCFFRLKEEDMRCFGTLSMKTDELF